MIAGGWAISRHTDGWRERGWHPWRLAARPRTPPLRCSPQHSQLAARKSPLVAHLPAAAWPSHGGGPVCRRPGATAASRGGPDASRLPPPRQHPAGSRRCPGDASAGDRIGKSERRGIGGGDDERGRLRLPSVKLRWRIFTSCGSNEREPLDSFWKAEIQKMSHCDMPTLCHPI